VKLGCQPKIWFREATRAALEHGVDPVMVMAGERARPYVAARWTAFKRLAAKNYSFNSIGVASGFDHTTIRHAVKAVTPFKYGSSKTEAVDGLEFQCTEENVALDRYRPEVSEAA
jgi:hypothetical protein